MPGITVTGRVEDVRPYLQHALAAVAPMRIARGVQNKVLEAMAMEKPVIVSSKGLEGIDAAEGEHVLLADTAAGLPGLPAADYSPAGKHTWGSGRGSASARIQLG